jgi:hypothetical protein
MSTQVRVVAIAAAAGLAAVAVFMFVTPGSRAAGPVSLFIQGPNVAVEAVPVAEGDVINGDVQVIPQAAPAAVMIRKGKALAPRPTTAAIDPAKDPPAGEKTDIVTTARGDRVTGTVVAIDQGGKLRLKGPQFESEVVLSMTAVDDVVLKGGEKETGSDEILLANGDRLFGTLVAMSPEAVVIDTHVAGKLTVSPKVIRSIGVGRSEDVLVDSSFFTGQTEPWVIRGAGAWQIDAGALVCRNSGSAMVPVYAKLDQKEAVTLVAKVQSLQGGNLRCDMVLFADATDGGAEMGRYGRNSIFAMFTNGEAYLQYTLNSSTQHVGNRNFARATGSGVLRLSYDPATSKARMWIDSTDMGEYIVPTKIATGQYVMFNSVFPLKVDYVKVLRGVVPPSGDEDAGAPAAADENIAVQFANKDRVSALKIALADGQMTLTTSYGEIKCPPQQIARIVFGKKAVEEPIKGRADVRIRTGACRMTLQFDRLTADSLVGRADFYGGEVKLRRGSVQEIKFNIYK